MSLVTDIGRGVCPRCRQGRIFQGLMRMNPTCSSCELIFEREAGYFLGAMVVSYAISIVLYTLIYQVLKRCVPQGFHALLLETFFLYLPFVPFVFRYSRIIWIYFDQTMDPEIKPGKR
jgi:uncharacterized protein (DUF983 family)